MLRIARRMSRSNIRGAGVFTRLLRRLGMLNVMAQYRLGDSKFSVPVNRIPWDSIDVANYEKDFVSAFCCALSSSNNVTLFDCGADIGIFSALVCSQTRNIARIVAFEPSQAAHEVLSFNLSNLGLPFALVPKAVGSFQGCGRLERPRTNLTDHARFLVPGAGPIQVTTIDSMEVRGGDVAIKLDLEGGELEALKGARQTITSARECLIGLEANPVVVNRTRTDPVECLRLLESMRRFHFLVAETGETPSVSGPLLRDGQTKIWNIVAKSQDGALI